MALCFELYTSIIIPSIKAGKGSCPWLKHSAGWLENVASITNRCSVG